MKKIAIISFFHPEYSLCLSKYISEKSVQVDFIYIAGYIGDLGEVPGFEYRQAKKKLGLHKLTEFEIPEIIEWSKNSLINFYMLRLLSYTHKTEFINKIIIRLALSKIKDSYDCIFIVGQHPLVSYIHQQLYGLNIVHILHEIGSHQDCIATNPLLNRIIDDKSKVIVLSESSRNRFLAIPKAEHCNLFVSKMGKFETYKLYQKKIDLHIPLDLTKPTFLFWGIIKPYKGLDFLKQALTSIKINKDQFNLIIAGSGQSDSLQYFKEQENCFVINRHLNNAEVIYLNELSYAILLPYKTASQSGIVPTSFLFSKPIISTNAGALLEVIQNNNNGLIVDVGDYIAFANAMSKLLTDNELYKELERGTKLFGEKDDYDWNNIASKVLYFGLS